MAESPSEYYLQKWGDNARPNIFRVQLWLVFKVTKEHGMEFSGVFDDESLAVAACISREYGYGPAILNKTIPDKLENWKGFRYPLIEKEYAEAGVEYPLPTQIETEQPRSEPI